MKNSNRLGYNAGLVTPGLNRFPASTIFCAPFCSSEEIDQTSYQVTLNSSEDLWASFVLVPHNFIPNSRSRFSKIIKAYYMQQIYQRSLRSHYLILANTRRVKGGRVSRLTFQSLSAFHSFILRNKSWRNLFGRAVAIELWAFLITSRSNGLRLQAHRLNIFSKTPNINQMWSKEKCSTMQNVSSFVQQRALRPDSSVLRRHPTFRWSVHRDLSGRNRRRKMKMRAQLKNTCVFLSHSQVRSLRWHYIFEFWAGLSSSFCVWHSTLFFGWYPFKFPTSHLKNTPD